MRNTATPLHSTHWMIAIALLTLTLPTAVADDRQRNALELFENHVRPTLVDQCIRCHGPEKQQAGLRLDRREGWAKGGDSGPAIVPGELDSLLLKAIGYQDHELEMPPRGKLPDRTIEAFQRWVELGALDPRTPEPLPPAKNQHVASKIQPPTIEQGRSFWSFRPVQQPTVPNVENKAWPKTSIDQFVLGRLEDEGLAPVRDADRVVLLRRIYFDLIGLPPTVKQIEQFLSDPSPTAYESLVDRLLNSHHFGERWGRHWLDVVRFAESSGGGRTLIFPDAWRYRDYVIDSFNRDVPYDRFLIEQLAGDLLDCGDWQQKRRNLVATTFLLLGPTNYEMQDKEILEMDVVDEQLDTLGKAMLGMTIGCARCHDHKFDPIPACDYYAMAGILKSTRSLIHSNVSQWNTVNLPLPAEEEAAIQLHEKSAPARPVAMSVTDNENGGDIHLAIRGVVNQKGPVIPRGVMQVAAWEPFPAIPDGRSGRKELAEWIADARHPLTSRVMVNRVWHWLFGRGIVATVDNFGSTGEPPTHPELLDHLASGFTQQGWSIKQLIREIVTSHVYQLSSDVEESSKRIDPDNRLLWRMNRKRLLAEDVRDSLLLVSGSLDFESGGPNIKEGTKSEYGYQFSGGRRSVYVPVFRNALPEIFEVFDFADPNIPRGRRTSSTVASQALLMMNHPWVIEQSRVAASHLLEDFASDPPAGVRHAYLQVLGRPPSEREQAVAVDLVTLDGENESGPLRWAMLYQVLFQCIDFRYLD